MTTAMAALAVALLAQPASAIVIREDVQFLQQAHQGNLAEISAGQLATVSGNSQTVKDVGATMVADHTTLDTAVTQLAARLGVSLPASPNPEQQAVATRLRQNKGAAFDSLFVATQLDAHTTALADAQTEMSRGGDPNVIAAARSSAPVIEKHIQMLRAASAELNSTHT
jgi:putative membrane protein